MASSAYTSGQADLVDGSVNYLTDTIKGLIVTSAYTFDPAHNFVDDVVANELVGAGYARFTLGSKTISVANPSVLDAADPSPQTIASGETIGGIILFKDAGGVDSANPLIAFLDVTNVATNGSAVTITFPAGGLITFTRA